jgi:hypothetical protein
MPPALTRYLYFVDEVYLSLLTAIIKKAAVEECLFWAAEIFYSELAIWPFLWTVYYDFFAAQYPKHMKRLSKLEKKNGIEDVLVTVATFRHLIPNWQTFYLRLCSSNTPIPKTSSPQWLVDLDLPDEEERFLRALDSESFPAIATAVSEFKNSAERLYELLRVYYSEVKGIEVPILPAGSKANDYHTILSILSRLLQPDQRARKHVVFRKLETRWLGAVTTHNDETIDPLYKTLPAKRLFRISEDIGCFRLDRYKLPWQRGPRDAYALLRRHWEFFAYFTPIWKKRLDAHGAKFNPCKAEVFFPNDDLLEEFGEKWNYEPDEQSLPVQEMSVRDIERISAQSWLSGIFPKSSIPAADLLITSYY